MTARAALLALALLVATLGQAASYAPDDWPRGWLFADVVDGDTIVFAVPALPDPLARILVRLHGVDTPEIRRPSAWPSGKPGWKRRASSPERWPR